MNRHKTTRLLTKDLGGMNYFIRIMKNQFWMKNGKRDISRIM